MRLITASFVLSVAMTACGGDVSDPPADDPASEIESALHPSTCHRGRVACSDGTTTVCCSRQETCCIGQPFATPTCTIGNICPISRRQYKTDVTYLASGDVERLYQELMRYRLATYRYKDQGTAAPEHLGFMIDDVAPSLSVEGRTGDHVDLYGYTSMAVAALQVQARQIEDLQREVRSMRAEIERRDHRRTSAR